MCTWSSLFQVLISCGSALKTEAKAGLFLSTSYLNDISDTQTSPEVTHLSDYTISLLFEPKLFLNSTFFQSLQ